MPRRQPQIYWKKKGSRRGRRAVIPPLLLERREPEAGRSAANAPWEIAELDACARTISAPAPLDERHSTVGIIGHADGRVDLPAHLYTDRLPTM